MADRGPGLLTGVIVGAVIGAAVTFWLVERSNRPGRRCTSFQFRRMYSLSAKGILARFSMDWASDSPSFWGGPTSSQT